MSDQLAENKLHPLQIADARDAAFKASEKQREVEDLMSTCGRALANAERLYRQELTKRILALHTGEDGKAGLAITMCETVAKGEVGVSNLRFQRDIAKANLEAAQQQAFRRGADRKSIDRLLEWSQYRDLRTDTPPTQYSSDLRAA